MDGASQAEGAVKTFLEDQTRMNPLVEEEEEEEEVVVEGTLATTAIEEGGTPAAEAIEEGVIKAVEAEGACRMSRKRKSREPHDPLPYKSVATGLTTSSWPPLLEKRSCPLRGWC